MSELININLYPLFNTTYKTDNGIGTSKQGDVQLYSWKYQPISIG